MDRREIIRTCPSSVKRYSPLNLFLFCCLLLIYSCSHETFSGAWQATPVKIDARINDWDIPLRFYDDGTKLNYSVTNDLNNLYICIRATNSETQLKIMRAGMKIWIDTTGNKKHDIGIFFPISSGDKMQYGELTGSDSPNYETESRHDRSKNRANFLASNKEMQVVGFKPPIGGIIPIHSDSGINLNMNWDSLSTLICEIKIPFSAFYKKSLTASDNVKIFNVGIFVNGLEVSSPSGRSAGTDMSQPSGMPGGSYGASGMGGMNSGRLAGNGFAGAGTRGGGATNYGTLTHTKSIWTRFNLSVK